MYKSFFKRFLDFWIALLALTCLSPLMLVVAVWLHFANKKGSLTPNPFPKGEGSFIKRWFAPVIFLQERPGKNEKMFKIIKFKSMTDERDVNGIFLSDKDRLTTAGKFVRKTSIDELPQLLNVLKGDMALIGPRPLLPEYLPYYTERERLRHTVRPGITGWAQVNGRNNLSWDEKLEFDAYYVEHLSLAMDVRVFVTTIKNVIGEKDVIVVPNAIMGIGKLNEERADRKRR